MIELKQLRYLLAAAEAGSFSRAARLLNIKQATLSRQIGHIEKRLGMPQFDRSLRGAKLTKHGEFYIRSVERLVTEFDDLNSWVRATCCGTAGHLTVGFHTSFSAGNLRATVTEFGDKHPDVKMRGVEREQKRLLGGLENRTLDLAVMAGEIFYAGLRARPFWSERILVALPEQHDLAERERITWPDLAGEHFLLAAHETGPENAQILYGKLANSGVRPIIDVEEICRDSLLSVVSLGKHISIVTETAVGFHYPGIIFREIHENGGQVWLGFSGYWHEENDNPVLKRFLDFVEARYSLPPVNGCPRSRSFTRDAHA
ncbi:LysR family transcriptional regulator [Tsuneonella suprasediminis]|uniref:LysR substrate-binding domain-containing protein n=1 Tax=Tsuneonella suprasediminis TaxID=2306996 RepID=UPI002F95965F